MFRINQFKLEPGPYMHTGNGMKVVVTEINTHAYVNSDQIERDDPLVIFRPLVVGVDKYITYSMPMSEFKTKFNQI